LQTRVFTFCVDVGITVRIACGCLTAGVGYGNLKTEVEKKTVVPVYSSAECNIPEDWNV
jgi:hypothetical protein